MKPFQFTVPEFPLSKAEKLDHEKKRQERRGEIDQFVDSEGNLTEEGHGFLEWSTHNDIENPKSYFRVFLKERALLGLYTFLFYAVFMILLALFSQDKGLAITRVSKNLPLFFVGYLGMSMIWFRSSHRKYLEEFRRLRALEDTWANKTQHHKSDRAGGSEA